MPLSLSLSPALPAIGPLRRPGSWPLLAPPPPPPPPPEEEEERRRGPHRARQSKKPLQPLYVSLSCLCVDTYALSYCAGFLHAGFGSLVDCRRRWCCRTRSIVMGLTYCRLYSWLLCGWLSSWLSSWSTQHWRCQQHTASVLYTHTDSFFIVSPHSGEVGSIKFGMFHCLLHKANNWYVETYSISGKELQAYLKHNKYFQLSCKVEYNLRTKEDKTFDCL